MVRIKGMTIPGFTADLSLDSFSGKYHQITPKYTPIDRIIPAEWFQAYISCVCDSEGYANPDCRSCTAWKWMVRESYETLEAEMLQYLFLDEVTFPVEQVK